MTKRKAQEAEGAEVAACAQLSKAALAAGAEGRPEPLLLAGLKERVVKHINDSALDFVDLGAAYEGVRRPAPP